MMLIIMRVYRSGYRRILKVPIMVTVILMAMVVVVTVALAVTVEAAVISKRLEND